MVEILNAHGTNAKGIVPSTKKKITMNAIGGKILQHTAYKGGGGSNEMENFEKRVPSYSMPHHLT